MSMTRPVRFRLLAIWSLILVVVHLPSGYTSPLEFFAPGVNARGLSPRGDEPGRLGAVASESSLCTQHGTDILQKGGNAADAVSRPPHFSHLHTTDEAHGVLSIF